MIRDKTYAIHSIDLVEKTCGICGKTVYPAILSSVDHEWNYRYTCGYCLAEHTNAQIKEIEDLIINVVKNKNINSFVDTSWTQEETVQGLFEAFTEMEEQDRKHIRNLDMWKVHSYLDGLTRGLVLYSEDEMIDYFNFYNNNIDVVTTLHYLVHKNPSNNFLMNTYIDSRTKKLSKEQLDALKRNRNFNFLSTESNKFWGKVEHLSDDLNKLAETTETLKLKSILKAILENEYFTEKQKDYVEYYARLKPV